MRDGGYIEVAFYPHPKFTLTAAEVLDAISGLGVDVEHVYVADNERMIADTVTA